MGNESRTKHHIFEHGIGTVKLIWYTKYHVFLNCFCYRSYQLDQRLGLTRGSSHMVRSCLHLLQKNCKHIHAYFSLKGIGTKHGRGMRLLVHTALLHSQSLNTCLSNPKRKDQLLAVYVYLVFTQNLSLRWCLLTFTVSQLYNFITPKICRFD